MKRILVLAALVASIFAGTLPAVASAEEFNVGSIRLNNGTPCSPSQCQIVLNSGAGYTKTAVTGSSRSYLGYFYVWPDMSYRYVSFNANAYIYSEGFGYYLSIYGRIFCGGFWHTTPSKSFYERGTSSSVYLGALYMSSPC